ncbi:hypothetical protein ASF82_06200 [Frigoribacterium sp. Leaf164]|uniref:hypothetical protein n=1 Tax=Frigoribacterium sp. Leaf164 TaxID=1736282 RepID=UPI0006F912B3|nr:hypothetical protein [Frigoribacterium sp. Leaf164]KQR46964.1 hypothetical protein ASF82_06200 [Frigoribacterium sp. Leaf164]
MPVPPGHPRCFRLDGRLFVVPTWSDVSVVEARDALSRSLSVARRPPRGTRRRERWGPSGAVVGAGAIVVVAVAAWQVTSLVGLAATGASGALVGGVLAVGVRRLVVDAGAGAAASSTSTGDAGSVSTSDGQGCGAGVAAVEVPDDVAAAAPDDATGDELALWSALVMRYRDAREALLSGARPGSAVDDADTDPADATARIRQAEADLRSAEADYEPVARLLGLPAP